MPDAHNIGGHRTDLAVTCQQQGRSAFTFLCDAVEALLNETPAPALLSPDTS